MNRTSGFAQVLDYSNVTSKAIEDSEKLLAIGYRLTVFDKDFFKMEKSLSVKNDSFTEGFIFYVGMNLAGYSMQLSYEKQFVNPARRIYMDTILFSKTLIEDVVRCESKCIEMGKLFK